MSDKIKGMKESMSGLTPLEMDNIEKGRLSLEEAQEMANLILTKLDGFDFKKLEPKDYEEAMAEVETLRKWAKGDETKLEDLDEMLFGLLRATPLVMMNHLISKSGNSPELNALLMGAAGLAGVGMALGSVKNRRANSEKALSQLEEKTEQRIEAEKKFG